MKGHSVHIEERTVYICTCKAEFASMSQAEAHLRNPPVEKVKSPQPTKPKKRAHRRMEQEAVATPEQTVPSTGLESMLPPTEQ